MKRNLTKYLLGVLLMMATFGNTTTTRAADSDAFEAGVAAALAARPDAPSLLGDDPLAAFGTIGGDNLTLELIDKAPRHLRAETLAATPHRWSVQLIANPDVAVKQGDVLFATFRIRNPEASDGREGRTEFAIEESHEPWRKDVSYPVVATGDWELHSVPIRIERDHGPGEWSVLFRLGYGPQVVELADVRLRHFGRDVSIQDLPRRSRQYPGMAPDAPWRDAAAERIDRHRKADLAVEVIDAEGNPLPGADVHVQMTRHAFWFGSAVKFWRIAEPGEFNDTYRRHIEELFNHVVNENDLKWPCWAGQWSQKWTPEKSIRALRWLDQRDIHVKGHCLIWPSWKHTASRLEKLKDDPAAMRRMISEHFADVIGRTRQWVDEWDVINEPFNNNDVMQVLGDDEMVEWFKLADKHAPQARLYLNDFGILAAGGRTDTPHQQHYQDTIRMLLDRGAPLQGLGMQSHFGESITPPEALLKILDRYAEFGLPIQITEFDVATDDQTFQANYTRDFMTAVFSHPAVNGFVIWGFHEGNHWRPNAAMYRKDWSIKPNGEAYKKLVFDEWWTDERKHTADNGRASFRGFKGDYRITVTHDDHHTTQAIRLDDDAVLRVNLAE